MILLVCSSVSAEVVTVTNLSWGHQFFTCRRGSETISVSRSLRGDRILVHKGNEILASYDSSQAVTNRNGGNCIVTLGASPNQLSFSVRPVLDREWRNEASARQGVQITGWPETLGDRPPANNPPADPPCAMADTTNKFLLSGRQVPARDTGYTAFQREYPGSTAGCNLHLAASKEIAECNPTTGGASARTIRLTQHPTNRSALMATDTAEIENGLLPRDHDNTRLIRFQRDRVQYDPETKTCRLRLYSRTGLGGRDATGQFVPNAFDDSYPLNFDVVIPRGIPDDFNHDITIDNGGFRCTLRPEFFTQNRCEEVPEPSRGLDRPLDSREAVSPGISPTCSFRQQMDPTAQLQAIARQIVARTPGDRGQWLNPAAQRPQGSPPLPTLPAAGQPRDPGTVYASEVVIVEPPSLHPQLRQNELFLRFGNVGISTNVARGGGMPQWLAPGDMAVVANGNCTDKGYARDRTDPLNPADFRLVENTSDRFLAIAGVAQAAFRSGNVCEVYSP